MSEVAPLNLPHDPKCCPIFSRLGWAGTSASPAEGTAEPGLWGQRLLGSRPGSDSKTPRTAIMGKMKLGARGQGFWHSEQGPKPQRGQQAQLGSAVSHLWLPPHSQVSRGVGRPLWSTDFP